MANVNPPVEPAPESEPAPSLRAETVVWEGCSSHVVNFRTFLYCLIALIVIGAMAWGFHYLAQPERSPYLAAHQKWFYLFFGILALIPIVIALYLWIENRSRRYRVTTDRINLISGVLSKNQDDLELYRVRDYVVKRPFFLRLFGLGTIELVTSDRTTPILKLEAIRDAENLLNLIREQVEYLRKTKRVREVDME